MRTYYLKFTNRKTKSVFATPHHTDLAIQTFLQAIKRDEKIYGKNNVAADCCLISEGEYRKVTEAEKKREKQKDAAK